MATDAKRFRKLSDDMQSLERERQNITTILMGHTEEVSEVEREKMKARKAKIGVAINKLLKEMVEVDRAGRR